MVRNWIAVGIFPEFSNGNGGPAPYTVAAPASYPISFGVGATTPQDIMMLGEKMFTLLKAYTVRQGLSRKDDVWPRRFYTEPLPEGPAKGAVLSRNSVEQLLDEYYELRGWDKTLGIPSRDTMIRLGLHDIVKSFPRSP